MTYLFISYAHKDEELVYRLTEELLDRGYDLWIDNKDIHAGKDWEKEIAKAILGSAYFLLVATDNAAASEYVKKEVEIAQKKVDESIIPLIVSLDALKTLGVDSRQGINFAAATRTSHDDYTATIEKLVSQLPNVRPDPNRRWNIKEDLENASPDLKIVHLEKDWRAKILPFGPSPGVPVGLLIGRTLYGMNAYLVAPRNAAVRVPQSVQVFLNCTGETNEFDTRFTKNFKKYLDSTTPPKPMWTVLIEGPIRDVKYRLPNDPDVWTHVIKFTFGMIAKAASGADTHEFYLNAPVSLGMMLGARAESRKGFTYQIFHYDADAKKGSPEKLYFCVKE